MPELWIDATELSRSPRSTGIQRVVFEVVRAKWKGQVHLVKFSPRLGGFEEIRRITDSQGSENPPQPGKFRPSLHKLVDNLWVRMSNTVSSAPLAEKIQAVAKFAYRALLAGNSPAKAFVGTGRLVDPPALWLLDIPADNRHLKHLTNYSRAGKTLGIYLHDVIPTKLDEIWSSDLNDAQRRHFLDYLNLVHTARIVACNSQFTLSEYLRTCTPKTAASQETMVLYPPVDLSQRLRIGEKRGRTKVVPKRQSGCFSVMAVSPLLRRKNIRVALAALLLLVKDPEICLRFVLVCPASFHIDEVARNLLKELGQSANVELVWRRDVSEDELDELYARSDVVLVPSLYEGFGLPILEGLATGNRVLASDIAVFRELAKHVDIELVDPHAAEEWCNYLRTFHDSSPEHHELSKIYSEPSNFVEVLAKKFL